MQPWDRALPSGSRRLAPPRPWSPDLAVVAVEPAHGVRVGGEEQDPGAGERAGIALADALENRERPGRRRRDGRADDRAQAPADAAGAADDDAPAVQRDLDAPGSSRPRTASSARIQPVRRAPRLQQARRAASAGPAASRWTPWTSSVTGPPPQLVVTGSRASVRPPPGRLVAGVATTMRAVEAERAVGAPTAPAGDGATASAATAAASSAIRGRRRRADDVTRPPTRPCGTRRGCGAGRRGSVGRAVAARPRRSARCRWASTARRGAPGSA